MEKIHVGDTVTGTVKNVTDFGAFIDLGGADGLLHISEMSWGRVENPKKVFNVGDEVKVLIKEINGDKIALSMKFPEENPWLSAAEDFAVGNVVTGKVARMTDFGALLNLHLELMHFFMYPRFPKSTLLNHLMYFLSDRKFRLKLLISTEMTRRSVLA